MSSLFHTFVYDPLYNLLIGLYDTVSFGDFGIAIIVTTILLKLALIPLSKKQIESQKGLQEIQPKIKALQEKYKEDKEKQAKELMALYKKEGVNPLGGCLPLIIQLIFFIAIYQVLNNIAQAEFLVDQTLLYSFVPNPGKVDTLFLGFIELSKSNAALALITAGAQYYQMKMMMNRKEKEKGQQKEVKKKEETSKNPDFAEIMNTQMLYIFPVLTLVIGLTFGAGLILYWLTTTLFMIAQQWYVMRKKSIL